MKLLFLLLTITAGIASTTPPKMTISVKNIKAKKGNLIIAVFNENGDFLKEGAAVKTYTVKVDDLTETLIINDLPKGNYAISMYHDENSDGKCNRNFLGIPKEGYAFSNNFKPKLSAPDFEDCEFSFTSDAKMEISLIH
ncbi:DUF2141 domain-containing protein [Nonlabens antarcticus]|uniref:DUF2141 domain-containing protein n=1 Tax=Nonlabens antarcticus TaxID=392714 RepID=UPI001891E546|nr:DUF2141 domain-containing protein [Nonlabens antarcticus]